MYPDFKELLSTLNAHKAKYLIVGGFAVGFHSQPRATKDLDILIRPDAQNAKAVYDALARFGAPLEGVTPHDFLDPDGFFRMGQAPVMIEILPFIKGVEFNDAWQRRVEIVIDRATSGSRRCRCDPEGGRSPTPIGKTRNLAPGSATLTKPKGDYLVQFKPDHYRY